MKNNIFKSIEYLYYISLIILLILYLFPGSLIGYFLYNDLGKQPNLISNPIGNSINHFFFFAYLSILASVCSLKRKQILTNFYFILLIAIFLEMSHFIIPNRAFQYFDLIANMSGVMVYFMIKKII